MIVRLEHIAETNVLADIAKIAPNWLNEDVLPQGISVIKVPPTIEIEGTYDEEGNVITEPIYNNTFRYDVNIHPKYEHLYQEVEFDFVVTPNNPVHVIRKEL